MSKSNKFAEALQLLVDTANEIPSVVVILDEGYQGNVHIEWHGVLCLEIPPKDCPKAFDAIKTLQDIGIETL
jgi:aspartate/methionine/tyrosine aminotransferase